MLETLSNTWLFAAGIAAFGCALTHIFAGGPEIARPLLAAKDIKPVPKYVNYYCWHLVSITLIAMSIAFLWSAYHPSEWMLPMMWTVMSVAFMLWNLGLIIWKRQSFILMPQWILFAIVSVPAIMGVLRQGSI